MNMVAVIQEMMATKMNTTVDVIKQGFEKGIPLGVMPTDKECALPCLFLASDYAKVMTGAMIGIAGTLAGFLLERLQHIPSAGEGLRWKGHQFRVLAMDGPRIERVQIDRPLAEPITDNAAANLAGIGPGLYKSNTAPQTIMTAAESYFLQAEARFRGFMATGPTVATLTNTAITESFRYIGAGDPSSYLAFNAGYSDVDVTAVSNSPVNPAGTQPVGGLFTIISQKWFALNGINTLEVWTDYRRMGYNEVVTASPINDRFVYGVGTGYDPGPPISVSPQNTSTKIPTRYLYPQSEYNYNPTNVAAQGTIDRYSKIFWDIN